MRRVTDISFSGVMKTFKLICRIAYQLYVVPLSSPTTLLWPTVYGTNAGPCSGPGWCFVPTSHLNSEWNRCNYQSVRLAFYNSSIHPKSLSVNWGAYLIFLDLLTPNTADDPTMTAMWCHGGTKRYWCLSGHSLLRYIHRNAAAFGWQLSSTTQQEGWC